MNATSTTLMNMSDSTLQDEQKKYRLLARFNSFYQSIAEIKQAITTNTLPVILSPGQSSTTLSDKTLTAMVSHHLQRILEQQRKEVYASGTASEIEAYETALYVMAALADELFILEVDWDGSKYWTHFLLEKSFYNSGVAGRNFFQKLEALLKKRNLDPLNEELATVFLLAIRLGFKGEYRGKRGEEKLANYRSDLLRFIGKRDSHSSTLPAFNQAYQHRISDPQGIRLAPTSRWHMIAGGLLIAYFLISQLTWVAMTSPLIELFETVK